MSFEVFSVSKAIPSFGECKMISPKLYVKVAAEGMNVRKLIDCKYHQCVELIQKKLIYLKPLSHGSMKTLLFFVFVQLLTSI